MAEQQAQSARRIAAEVLTRCQLGRSRASAVLEPELSRTQQRQRATDLVLGTLRNRGAIDTVIESFSGRPVEHIQPTILNILRVAAYELIYNPATPIYSIVHQAVENTKALAGRKQVRFVNAVLRQITRHIRHRQTPLAQAELACTLPQGPDSGCQFDTAILPDPAGAPTKYLASAFSLPKWLVRSWAESFGAEASWQICFGSNRKPSVYLRPNRLRTSREQLLRRLTQAGVAAEPTPETSLIKVRSPRRLSELPGFAEGLFSVQDPAAFAAVATLQPEPNWRILDLCAAPGGKTAQMAEATGDNASIIATDIDAQRLTSVRHNLERLGITSVTVIDYEKLQTAPEQFGPFDAILLDVPCSNTAVLARRPEVRYRISRKALHQLAERQRRLLQQAVELLGPAGKICYSTCSIQAEENQHLIQTFLAEHSEFALEAEKLTLPCAGPFDHDGGYVAVLVKRPLS